MRTIVVAIATIALLSSCGQDESTSTTNSVGSGDSSYRQGLFSSVKDDMFATNPTTNSGVKAQCWYRRTYDAGEDDRTHRLNGTEQLTTNAVPYDTLAVPLRSQISALTAQIRRILQTRSRDPYPGDRFANQVRRQSDAWSLRRERDKAQRIHRLIEHEAEKGGEYVADDSSRLRTDRGDLDDLEKYVREVASNDGRSSLPCTSPDDLEFR